MRNLPIVLCVFAAPLASQITLPSGPEANAPVRPVPSVVVVGEQRGAEVDAAAGFAQGPGVLLFVHELTRETAPMIRAVDELGVTYAVRGLRTAIIRVADDRTEAETRMPLVSKSLRLRRPIVVSVDGGDGPGDYALNRKATLSVVVTLDGVVQRAFGLTDTGRKDVPMLEEAVAAVAGPKPDLDSEPLPADAAALQQLVRTLQRDNALLREELQALRDRQQQQRAGRGAQGRPAMPRDGDARPRGTPEIESPSRPSRGAPDAPPAEPRDADLSRHIRVIVRKDVSDEQIAEAFEAIDARLEAQPTLVPQAQQMLERVLRESYGTPTAQKRAKTWLDGRKK